MTKVVRAIQKGFYGDKLREVGEVFEVQDGHVSSRWMELAEPPAPAESAPTADEPPKKRPARRRKATSK